MIDAQPVAFAVVLSDQTKYHGAQENSRQSQDQLPIGAEHKPIANVTADLEIINMHMAKNFAQGTWDLSVSHILGYFGVV